MAPWLPRCLPRSTTGFQPPPSRCAGEYNLRLGVIKELRPDLIATHQGDVRVFEGHAFIVEAAVSIGGHNVRPGLNVHRFANRIPLLFEGGSDVVTRTAMKRINWASYKINHSSDRVGVFVSIVSTKIPFKGAGKEYIGADLPAGSRLATCYHAVPVRVGVNSGRWRRHFAILWASVL